MPRTQARHGLLAAPTLLLVALGACSAPAPVPTSNAEAASNAGTAPTTRADAPRTDAPKTDAPSTDAVASSPRMVVIDVRRPNTTGVARPPAPDYFEAHILHQGIALYHVSPAQGARAKKMVLLSPQTCHGVTLTVCATTPMPADGVISPTTLVQDFPVHKLYAVITAQPGVKAGKIRQLSLASHPKIPYALVVRVMDTARFWRVGPDGACASSFTSDEALLEATPCETPAGNTTHTHLLLPEVVLMTSSTPPPAKTATP